MYFTCLAHEGKLYGVCIGLKHENVFLANKTILHNIYVIKYLTRSYTILLNFCLYEFKV